MRDFVIANLICSCSGCSLSFLVFFKNLRSKEGLTGTDTWARVWNILGWTVSWPLSDIGILVWATESWCAGTQEMSGTWEKSGTKGRHSFLYKNVLYKKLSDQNKERNKKVGVAGKKVAEEIRLTKKYWSLELAHIEK